MDRGAPLGAKVYADMINNMGIDRVICLDPHSDVAPALYDRLTVVGPESVIEPRIGLSGIIAPDLGARKRAEAVANLFALPVYQAGKVRDFNTGNLSGFECEKLRYGRYLIVDDICDGGGTFIGLAEHLKATQGILKHELQLWVTHGIFSKDAMLKLTDHFSYVGSTDSHPGSDALNYSYSCTTKVVPILDKLVKVLTGGY
jgi:ribose-phosphate pyrophosphokinase